jgi:hypothetical protein
MSENEMMKIIESIPHNETYSKYNSTLEKIFKSQSLRHYINVYKNRRTMSFDKNEANDFNTNVFGDELLYKKLKEDEENNIFDDTNGENEKGEPKLEETKEDFWKKIVEMKKNKIEYNLDPFKYHPNYNSIYKNIPSVKITEPTKTKLKEKSKDKNNYKKMEKKKMNKLLITEINHTFNEEKKQTKDRNNKSFVNINLTDTNIKKEIKLPKLSGNPKNKNMTLITNRNNHAIRFSKYLPRKFIIPDHNKNISYINPFNYIKPKNKTKSIDFNKMLHRNDKTLIYTSSLKTPSFCQYNPKYDWVDKDKCSIYFNPLQKNEKKHKKYLIKKICTSYNVNTEYEILNDLKK